MAGEDAVLAYQFLDLGARGEEEGGATAAAIRPGVVKVSSAAKATPAQLKATEPKAATTPTISSMNLTMITPIAM